MRIRSGIFRASLVTIGIAVELVFSVSIASSDDMRAMPGMGETAMIHTMAPGAMGAHMHMDDHMRMTALRPATPEDLDRARDILEALRSSRSISRYRDYRVALAQGWQIFLPAIPQDVYHFTNYAVAAEEYRGHVNHTRPGSMLYTKNADGSYALIGAMYSAPPDATPEDLDAIVPLSVARWHVHTNICLPNGISLDDLLRGEIGAEHPATPGMLAVSASPNAIELNRRYGFMADGRFGFEGKISDATKCTAADGYLLPQAFGWMVHIYPFSSDDLKVAFGMEAPNPSSSPPRASR